MPGRRYGLVFLRSLALPVIVLAGSLLLTGCPSAPVNPPVSDLGVSSGQGSTLALLPGIENAGKPGYYIVEPGDTIRRIAAANNRDWRDLIRWNNFDNPDKIAVGQVVRVIPPEPSAPPVASSFSPAQPSGTGVATATQTGLAAAPNAKGAVPATAQSASGPGSASSGKGGSLTSGASGATPNSTPGSTVVSSQGKAGGSASVSATGGATGGPPGSASGAAVSGSASASAAGSQSGAQGGAQSAGASSARQDAAGAKIEFIWPAKGPVLSGYDESKNKGIDIGGKIGDPVWASADGHVVYAGSGLRGYGNLVILQHSNVFLTAYAHNSSILVKENQNVKRGQKIALMGSVDSHQVELHFEIRLSGKPVNPISYLPSR